MRPTAVQTQLDDALTDRDELRTKWALAVSDASNAREAFAREEQLGSPTRIAQAYEYLGECDRLVDVAFRNFRASV